jgi:predicted HD phosphohydrolase
MAEREVDEFELPAGHDAVVRLRRIDDRAKVVDLEVPSLSQCVDNTGSVINQSA